jgi:cation transport ATPase
MKKLFILLLLISSISKAQFINTKLQVAGLTCAMCSFATQKQLQTINFIDSIGTDLETNTFFLTFKPGMEVHFDLIKTKVEDAGFSVSSLVVLFKNDGSSIQNNHLIVGDNLYHFIDKSNIPAAATNISFKLMDKGFISDKEFKKNSKKMDLVPHDNHEITEKLNTIKKVYHVQLL